MPTNHAMSTMDHAAVRVAGAVRKPARYTVHTVFARAIQLTVILHDFVVRAGLRHVRQEALLLRSRILRAAVLWQHPALPL